MKKHFKALLYTFFLLVFLLGTEALISTQCAVYKHFSQCVSCRYTINRKDAIDADYAEKEDEKHEIESVLESCNMSSSEKKAFLSDPSNYCLIEIKAFVRNRSDCFLTVLPNFIKKYDNVWMCEDFRHKNVLYEFYKPNVSPFETKELFFDGIVKMESFDPDIVNNIKTRLSVISLNGKFIGFSRAAIELPEDKHFEQMSELLLNNKEIFDKAAEAVIPHPDIWIYDKYTAKNSDDLPFTDEERTSLVQVLDLLSALSDEFEISNSFKGQSTVLFYDYDQINGRNYCFGLAYKPSKSKEYPEPSGEFIPITGNWYYWFEF